MNGLAIFCGLILIVVGICVWRIAEKTPEGELISWGWGEYWSRGRACFMAILGWLVGVIFIIVGIIL